MKTIQGFEGYSITEDGQVWSHSRKKFLVPSYTEHGYQSVMLGGKNGKKMRVHRLVGMAYIPNPNNFPHMNHKNAIRDDNRVENLEWCTHLYNMQDAVRRGTHQSLKDQKLTQEVRDSIKELRANGWGPTAISRELGLPYSPVRQYLRGKSYKFDPIGLPSRMSIWGKGYFWDNATSTWHVKFRGMYVARFDNENDAIELIKVLRKAN